MMMRECPRCGGSGVVDDDVAVGQWFRDTRLAQGVTLREAARRLEFSAAYVSDLERGRRTWNADLKRRFLAVVDRKVTEDYERKWGKPD